MGWELTVSGDMSQTNYKVKSPPWLPHISDALCLHTGSVGQNVSFHGESFGPNEIVSPKADKTNTL